MALACGCSKKSKDDDEPQPEPKPAPLVERIDAALGRAQLFFTRNQEPDGSWRSGTYAAFKDGYSLTPLVLAALRFTTRSRQMPPVLEGSYSAGVDYLTSMVDGETGALRDDLEAPRYPLYSLALATIVLNVPDNRRHRQTRDALVEELRSRQHGGDGPSRGGWGYPNQEANLSATLFAAGALRLAGVEPDDPSMVAAAGFVGRCQNGPPGGDGGFFFSPAPELADANKAGPRPGGDGYRSYGSMTADGVRALIRLGVPTSDPRVEAAQSWLDRHFEAEQNPGAFPEQAEVRRRSSYYYWVWSAAHAMRALGKDEGDWAAPLANALIAEQGAGGSWTNPYSEMRENDPYVATSFAAAALAVARVALTGEHRSH